MSIITDLTPVAYRLIRIGVQQEGTNVVAVADMQILNGEGGYLPPTTYLRR